MKTKRAKTVDPVVRAFLKKVGTRLVLKRKQIGYKSSDDFAYDKGINRSQYGKYEAGSQNMRVGSLLKAIHALGLTVEEFFREL